MRKSPVESPTVATYPSAGGRRETRGMRVPRKEYARSRHQRLFEENVGKTGKDAIYELFSERFGSCIYARGRTNEERRRTVETFARFLTENVTETFRKRLGLDFLHGNNFSKQIRKREKCLRGWTPSFFISSPIYSKIGEVVAAQLAQASSARPSEQGCFLQKQPPSGGIFWRAQVGLGAICTPIFTKPKATPPATPPPSPPPPPSPAVALASSSTLKWTSKDTRLRSLATRPPRAERPVVHVNPATRKADDPYKKKLRTYLGIVARDKVDVTYKTWKEVLASQKDLIWEDIQAEFDIPEASDGRTKKKVLQTVSERWRQFKSDLTRKWALVAEKDSVDDTVCEKYGISKEKWTQFCQTRREPSWQDVQKKAQAIQKQNTTLHVLSRGGYEYLEHKLIVEKTKKKLEEATQSVSTNGMIDHPSPIRQHVKWKMTRTKKTGKMTSEAAKEIAEKIDSLEEQASPEHPSRVRANGAGIGSTNLHSSSSMAPEELEQLTQQIRDQLEESITEKVTWQLMLSFSQMQSQLQSQIQSQGLALHPKSEVGPSAARVSIKGSCVDPSVADPNTGDSEKCELYIIENYSRLVALGRVYEGSTTIHNIPLLHGQVKVGVEEVKDAEAPIPVPTDEVKLVEQTLNTFLAWPTHLMKPVSPAKPPDRLDHKVDDPLYLMTLTIPQLFLKSLQVMWDATVFGHEDLSEIAHGGQCLSISVIQLWTLLLTETSIRAGNFDVYRFLEPQSIQRSGQSQFESESYMKSWMQSSKHDVYLGAYLNGALKGLDDTPQPKSKAGARWIVVKTIGSREIEGASHPVGTISSQS
ncbi:hypothetical protein HKD37_01G001038 [Glycine soja]